MNYNELMSSTNRVPLLTTHKKGCCMNGKKICESLLGEKYLSGKPVHFYVKNTANNADTWGVHSAILSAFTANSIVHLMV